MISIPNIISVMTMGDMEKANQDWTQFVLVEREEVVARAEYEVGVNTQAQCGLLEATNATAILKGNHRVILAIEIE